MLVVICMLDHLISTYMTLVHVYECRPFRGLMKVAFTFDSLYTDVAYTYTYMCTYTLEHHSLSDGAKR